MSFSRYKTLMRLTQFPLCKAECNYPTGSRFYTSEVTFVSSAPHDVPTKPKNLYKKIENNVLEKPRQNRKMVNKKNYRLEEDSKYQVELRPQDVVVEPKVIQVQNDQSISDLRTPNTIHIPDLPKKRLSFNSELEYESNSGILNKDAISVSCNVDQDNVSLTSMKNTEVISRNKIINTPEGPIKFDLSFDEFDVRDFLKELDTNLPKPLDECTEDLSDYGPNFMPTFNFAAYADKSKLIQEYVKLGVKLYKIEQNHDHMRALLSVDLEKELPLYIQFLHDCGVAADNLGDVITQNPMILAEDLDDMKTRIRYLKAHNFAVQSIARIITNNPTWLTWATKHIDERLGHFQNEFKLTGTEVRFLATKAPKLITYNMKHIHENTFAVREEMGFNKNETKVLILGKPRLWMNSRRKILSSFDYLHNVMNLSNLTIASQADILTCRKNRLRNRHEFLLELKKVQYDPKKPGYIAPKSVIAGSDAEFCRDIAKTPVDTYNLFLKTR